MELFGYGKLGTFCAAAGAQFADSLWICCESYVSLQSYKCHPGEDKQWLCLAQTV